MNNLEGVATVLRNEIVEYSLVIKKKKNNKNQRITLT